MAETITPLELEALMQQESVVLLDVRRRADLEAGPPPIPGAHWMNPEHVAEWAGDVPAGGSVVIYCVRGGSVSVSVQAALRERGVQARFVQGGLVAWDERRKEPQEAQR